MAEVIVENNAGTGTGRPTKRCKVVSYGTPHVFSGGENKETVIFQIFNFEALLEERDKYITTEKVVACGHLWYLKIYPRGGTDSDADTEHVSIFFCYAGTNDQTNPVIAKANVATKTITERFPVKVFSNDSVATRGYGFYDFSTRDNIIENDCDDAGMLKITVEIEVAVEKRNTWYPRLTPSDIFRTKLYGSTESSDVTFLVGQSQKEFVGHKCIILLRAKTLHELIITAAAAAADDEGNDDDTELELPDMDASIFEMLLEFWYTDKVPTISTTPINDDEEKKVTAILVACDRLGCTDLKLYMESILVDKFLNASTNTIRLLLLADSHSCALLKEAALNMYVAGPKTVKGSNPEDWNRLKESSDLLEELLDYATSEKKTYVPIVDSTENTTTTTTTTTTTSTAEENIDEYDVTSLRERLEQFDLDVDGSREMLVNRWEEYLLRTSITATTNNNSSKD